MTESGEVLPEDLLTEESDVAKEQDKSATSDSDDFSLPHKVGLALSGGGFRATLFHLGMIRFLRDAKVLKKVKRIVAVSGGSVLAADLVLNWEDYTGSDSAFEKAAQRLISFVKTDVRGMIIRRSCLRWLLCFTLLIWAFILWPRVPKLLSWTPAANLEWIFSLLSTIVGVAILALIWISRILLRGSLRTDLLAQCYARLYGNERLPALNPVPKILRPEVHLTATSMTDGQLYSFHGNGFARLTSKLDPEPDFFETGEFSVARAVAISSSFPPLFPPVVISAERLKINKYTLAMDQALTDGGVFDNSGIHAIRLLQRQPTADKNDLVIISDAGRPFDIDESSFRFLATRAWRTTDIQMRRLLDVELDESQLDPDEYVVPIHFEEKVENNLPVDVQRCAPNIRTDLDSFTEAEIYILVRHGYEVARERLSSRIRATRRELPWSPVKTFDSEPSHKLVQSTKMSSSRRFWSWQWKDWALWLIVAVLVANAAGFLILSLFMSRSRATPKAVYLTEVSTYSPGADSWIHDDPFLATLFGRLGQDVIDAEVAGETSRLCYARTPAISELNSGLSTTKFRCKLTVTRDYKFSGYALVEGSSTSSPLYTGLQIDANHEFEVPELDLSDKILILGRLTHSRKETFEDDLKREGSLGDIISLEIER